MDPERCKYCFVIETEKEKYIMGCHDRIPYKEDESELYNLSYIIHGFAVKVAESHIVTTF